MKTFWYETTKGVILSTEPQSPPPGRFMGAIDLTRSELELMEMMVRDERQAAATKDH